MYAKGLVGFCLFDGTLVSLAMRCGMSLSNAAATASDFPCAGLFTAVS